MTINVLSSVHRAPLSALLRGLNTPYALEVLADQQGGRWKSQFPPVTEDTSQFMKDYMAYNLLRKSRDGYYGIAPPSEEALVKKAVSGFLDVERRCAYFNKVGYIPGTAPSSEMLAPELIFHEARRKIAQVLGHFDLNEFSQEIDFSNGASTRLPRRDAAVPVKFTGKPHVTRSCALLAISLIWHYEPWRLYCQERFGRESDPCSWVEVVEGSEYFTVPKTADSLRGATKEPELNMLCQKALGRMVRRRLKRVRIDLDDQTYNQYLAGCGSRTGSLATIDLESASDSVSLRLVRDLLPSEWYRFFSMTRSEVVLLPDGSRHTLEKISSMGNGFTFELESLIFWALSKATISLMGVEDKRIGVIGDDIVVHHSAAQNLINCLAYCGFVTNVEKTWVSGPFRESCGKHWHYGFDVSPFFVKESLDDDANRFHMVNNLASWMHRLDASMGTYPEETYGYVVRKLLPSNWSFVPPHHGTRSGVIPPSSSHVPGLYYSLRSSGYIYRAFESGYIIRDVKRRKQWVPGRKTKRMRATPNYLTWFLKAQAQGSGGEPSEMAIHGVREVWRYKTRKTSRWSDCEVRLPETLLSLAK